MESASWGAALRQNMLFWPKPRNGCSADSAKRGRAGKLEKILRVFNRRPAKTKSSLPRVNRRLQRCAYVHSHTADGQILHWLQRTLSWGQYGIFLIMDNSGPVSISGSTVLPRCMD